MKIRSILSERQNRTTLFRHVYKKKKKTRKNAVAYSELFDVDRTGQEVTKKTIVFDLTITNVGNDALVRW